MNFISCVLGTFINLSISLPPPFHSLWLSSLHFLSLYHPSSFYESSFLTNADSIDSSCQSLIFVALLKFFQLFSTSLSHPNLKSRRSPDLILSVSNNIQRIIFLKERQLTKKLVYQSILILNLFESIALFLLLPLQITLNNPFSCTHLYGMSP